MIRYTTPTITLTVGGDISEADQVWVTLRQASKMVTVEKDDLTISYADEASTISFTLSQQQSAVFSARSSVQVQVNWMVGSTRIATEIGLIRPLENLLSEVK